MVARNDHAEKRDGKQRSIVVFTRRKNPPERRRWAVLRDPGSTRFATRKRPGFDPKSPTPVPIFVFLIKLFIYLYFSN